MKTPYTDLALEQLDRLAEAIEYTTTTDHLQPNLRDLDSLGAKHNILFDAEDVARWRRVYHRDSLKDSAIVERTNRST